MRGGATKISGEGVDELLRTIASASRYFFGSSNSQYKVLMPAWSAPSSWESVRVSTTSSALSRVESAGAFVFGPPHESPEYEKMASSPQPSPPEEEREMCSASVSWGVCEHRWIRFQHLR